MNSAEKEKLAFDSLIGKGLELGALHNPVRFNPERAKVVYADRLTKSDAITSFPELEAHRAEIVEPDLLIDIDQDDLTLIRDMDLDFVIANHVIEHVVNPIRFLSKIATNLKGGGVLFLTVPNKEYTHDVNRKLTRYSHLLIEYYLNTKRLSNRHIKDYLKNKLPVKDIPPETVAYFEQNNLPLSYYEGNKIPLNPLTRWRLYAYHHSRSIHVHVWNRTSFDFFLRRTIDLFDLQLEIKNYLRPEASPGEMIYLLKKSTI